MPKFNDFDLSNWNWKNYTDIWTDSLWIIDKRDTTWKHSNFYHGNFVPQIPRQFIKRYTKKWDYVLDMFVWSGTTAIECENLSRNIIWVDIQWKLIDRLDKLIDSNAIKKKFIVWDAWSIEVLDKTKDFLNSQDRKFVDLAILHPPYFDIIQFSDNDKDLSNTKNIDDFLNWFWKVLDNTYKLLKKDWYMVIVIWDKYQNSEWMPLWFLCMQEAQKLGFKLKSIIVKNMDWNRWKLWSWWIWRYRALNSDYHIFKHEYILVFKR